jgi:hypothetical protein
MNLRRELTDTYEALFEPDDLVAMPTAPQLPHPDSTGPRSSNAPGRA